MIPQSAQDYKLMANTQNVSYTVTKPWAKNIVLLLSPFVDQNLFSYTFYKRLTVTWGC